MPRNGNNDVKLPAKRVPIACPNQKCRRPLRWKGYRNGWQTLPHKRDGCAICTTPASFARAVTRHARGESWQQIRRENVRS
jgi:hypothetical protein